MNFLEEVRLVKVESKSEMCSVAKRSDSVRVRLVSFGGRLLIHRVAVQWLVEKVSKG